MIIKCIWTIGHSTHSFEKFLKILQSLNIECVADVRSFPGSKKFPHFNIETLEMSLPENHIEYIHLKDLGGRRKVKPDSRNTNWHHPAFRGHADYMETDEFRQAVNTLEVIAAGKRTAYMCSEALWWRCHRSLISDWLKLHGWKVFHILGESKVKEHPFTPASKIINGKLLYSPQG